MSLAKINNFQHVVFLGLLARASILSRSRSPRVSHEPQVIAGFTGRATSLGWRFPFLLVSAPCVVLSAVLYVATRDPPRGRFVPFRVLWGEEHDQRGTGKETHSSKPAIRSVKRCFSASEAVVIFLVRHYDFCLR